MMVFFSSLGQIFYLSIRDFIFITFGFFAVTFLVSVFLHIVIEAPFKNILHKLVLREEVIVNEDNRMIVSCLHASDFNLLEEKSIQARSIQVKK